MTEDIKILRAIEVLGKDIIRVVGSMNRTFNHPSPIREARTESAITFCNKEGVEELGLIRSTMAGVVLCLENQMLDEFENGEKTLLIVRSPRLSFLRLISAFFSIVQPQGIHPTTVIDPEAKIHQDVYIGPFTYIGKCEIGKGTVIHGHVHIYNGNVKIGENVVIHAGTVIGVDGFGYARNECDELEFFPSCGGVLIEDNVHIHSNVNIDRGTLSDTVIGRGTKIDKFCHIGHNVVIGKHCVITAHTMLGGSAKIGDYVWIAPCTSILNGGIEIGDRAFIGMSSVVTKNVPDDAVMMGAPARTTTEYKKLMKLLRQLINSDESKVLNG